MIVTDYKENEDGSADVKVHLSNEETASLIQFAFVEQMRRSIEEERNMKLKLEGFEAWWEAHGQYCRAGGGDYEKTFAFRAWEAATAAECERICTAIKAEDDHCADGDYMLDSDDCIAVAKGKWVRPDWNCGAPSNAELSGRPLADGPA